MRALILVRLSKVTDATTSPERQRKECEEFCARQGYAVVGVAEDLDVSGSIAALDRTGSGPWLRHRLDEFDVIVASKLDRIGRNARHISSLMNHLVDAGKNIRCAQDSTNISDPIGRMIVYVMATVAELELAGISQRNTGAAQHNIAAGKYRGGVAPAGYRAEKDDAGDWRLVPDETGMAPVIRGIFADVLAGKRLSGVVADLNARGVPTAKDRQAELNSREPEGRRWTVSNLRRMLASPTVIGQVVHRPLVLDADGKPKMEGGRKVFGAEQVLFADGVPLQRAEPLIAPADFYAVKRILDGRREAEPKQRRSVDTTLLLRVLHCGLCGGPMWRLKGGPGRQPRYRCGSTQGGSSCGSGTVTIAYADDAVSGVLLKLLGDFEYAEKVYSGGVDTAALIEEIDGQLASLAEAVTRFPAGSPAQGGLFAQVETLSIRRAELAAQPREEPGYRYAPTGVLFRDHWASLDSAGRNDFLRDNGVRATWTRYTGQDGLLVIEFGELLRMVWSVTAPGLADRLTEDQMNDALRESGIAGIRCVIGSGEPSGTTLEYP